MSSFDVEMVDPGHSESEPERLQRVQVAADVAAACKRGPERVTVKGKQYVWQQHEDNQRAFTKPSVIWQLGDEYEQMGSGYRKKYWRCGLCTKTKILAMNDNSTSGLRHLKKTHKIDESGQRMDTKQSTVTAAFAAATTVANLVTRFKASTFRYLFIRWIVSMHVALSCVENEYFREWALYVAPALDKYLIESGDTIRRWIIREFEKQRLEIKKGLGTARSRVHISFDGWTSPNSKGLVGVVFSEFEGAELACRDETYQRLSHRREYC
jgi:hypothetical protein